jgi:hypothetical protein
MITIQTITAPAINLTTDYFLFKFHKSNRPINESHVKNLVESMKKEYLFTVITVNEKNEICDGQHRFLAIKELKLPMFYVVMEGYGEKQMRIINSTNRVWSNDDYLNSFIIQGKSDYIDYQMFQKTYKLGHVDCQKILTWNHKSHGKDFKNGNFKIENYKRACSFMEKLLVIKKYYKGYKRTLFINAMMSLLNNPKFNFDEFILKLQQQQTLLVDCTKVELYISRIEEIYNYKRKEKVNLRYF